VLESKARCNAMVRQSWEASTLESETQAIEKKPLKTIAKQKKDNYVQINLVQIPESTR
jgi:hypothetical protein